jgi:bifunctional non-homologous end joining protein LigD
VSDESIPPAVFGSLQAFGISFQSRIEHEIQAKTKAGCLGRLPVVLRCKVRVVPSPPPPQRLAPTLMQATQIAVPFHRPGWIYEEKVDGYRIVAYKQDGSVQLVSRQGKEFTHRFPELAKAVAALGAESVILDTELAVFDRQLISRFEWLRARPEDDVATPPMLMAFDLLELDGADQRQRPLRERRQALEHLLKGERLILPVRRRSPSGLEAWKEVLRAGYEGLVAKDPESPYVGGRTLKWLKVKQAKYREGERGWEAKGKS